MSTTHRSSDDSPAPSASGRVGGRQVFVTTHWSVVLTAGRTDTTRARDALARLCQTYWYPLYAYVRRRGYSPHDAEDLTQGFFARLLELNSIAAVAPSKGRFRSFLLGAMNHFLSDARDHANALKRGAGKVVSLDGESAETRYHREPADASTPEKVYERQWALALLETVAGKLREEYNGDGKAELFEQLKFCLVGERSAAPHAELSRTLGLSEGAVRVAVHRLRQRYRQLLRDEIANTVTEAGEVEEELRDLMRVLAG